MKQNRSSHKYNKLYLILALLSLTVITALFSVGKDVQQLSRMADAAIFEQVIENINSGKGAVSNVFANTQNFIDRGYAGIPLSDLAQKHLESPDIDERDMLGFHAYYIMFFLAPFVNLFSSSLVLSLAQTFCYVGLLFGVSTFIYRESKSIIVSITLLLIVFLNPNWVGGIQGQFYPDRLFVLAGFFLLYLTYKRANLWQILIAVIIVGLINERSAFIGGLILLFMPLYCRSTKIRSGYFWSVLILGLILIIYSYVQKQYVLSNLYYGSFMPHDLNDLFYNRLSRDDFVDRIGVFVVNNGLLILLSLAAPRLAILSFVIMLPNIVGDIGGAEKIGWLTHYHSYYFPILTFSATVGCINIANKYHKFFKLEKYQYVTIFILITIVIVAHFNFIKGKNDISPFSFIRMSKSNLFDWMSDRPTGYSLREDVAAMFDPGSLVSTTEFGMALLHDRVKVGYFPIDVEKSDYLLIPCHYLQTEIPDSGGVMTFSSDWLAEKGFDPQSLTKIDSIARCRFTRFSY